MDQSQVTFSTLLGEENINNYATSQAFLSTAGGNIDTVNTSFSYQTIAFYSTVAGSSTQFSTYLTIYATDVFVQSVTFNYRFGTELQTLYFSDQSSTSYTLTYENIFNQTNISSGVSIETFYQASPTSSWQEVGYTYETFSSYVQSSGQTGLPNAIVGSGTITNATPGYFTGSSTFVNMLGSNVYTGLLVTTNSVIIYNNEQVSTYYSQSLSYQINVDNLTACLNSVSQTTGKSNMGEGTITVTSFSWAWYSLPGTGWTGTQYTKGHNYTFQTEVNSYLWNTYGSTISNSSEAVTQVQSIITVQNNYLSNSQTFLNNAVTTLQSQVSLAGQIIGSLASAAQSIITNMA
ncbi:MAG: hypothetical protein DVB29_06260 [Verrucomicrobia bacterium]|nr:MAG: hypothetical protein DVB29_06260 [Verrucomicrobiota bacterium]